MSLAYYCLLGSFVSDFRWCLLVVTIAKEVTITKEVVRGIYLVAITQVSAEKP